MKSLIVKREKKKSDMERREELTGMREEARLERRSWPRGSESSLRWRQRQRSFGDKSH